MKHLRVVLFAILAGAVAAPARAHFLWLTAEKDEANAVVEAFLSETPAPDSPAFLGHIAKSKITVGDKALPWTRGKDTYRIEVPGPAPKAVDGFCDLGVTKRGPATFRLLYTARVQFAPMAESDAELADNLRVRLVDRPGSRPVVQITFKGKPAPAAVVKAYPRDGKSIELKADAEGRVDMPGVAEGKAGLLAKWIEKGDGQADGKPFAETRYYSTFTVAAADSGAATADVASAGVTRVESSDPNAPFAVMPEAVNSFGGAVSNGWLYVYSGHVGDTHKYSVATTTAHFRRLNLGDRTTWEELPPGPALQGVTLLAHGGMLYRIGGASAKNQPGTPGNLASTDGFARFDPQNRTWTDLPKLPTPRSTHDAVVFGDKIYVVGGWSMDGGDPSGSEFVEDALVFDLARKDARWEKLPPPPFQRRALAVAEHAGKIYVLGGLTDGGKVVKDVDIYDPATKAWSKGPGLAGSQLQGFAASAFDVKGRLYVSGQDGDLHRLSDDGKSWEVAGRLAIPRLTHRLLPGPGESVLAVGGNFANSPVRAIELLPVDDAPGPKVVAWTVPVATEALQGQAIGLARSKLLAVGGNRTDAPHAFKAENLLADGLEISPSRMDSKAIAPLPAPRQSGVLVANPSKKSEAFLIGGIGPDGDISRTLGDIYTLDIASGKWSKSNARIPDDRGMFGTAVYKDAIYLFGGSIFDPRPDREERAMPVDVLRWEARSEGSTFEPIGQQSPTRRRSFAGAVLGTKYYMVGGLGDAMKLVDTVDVYDFEAKAWSAIPAPPRPRLFAELAPLNGRLYLAGGFTRPEGGHFEPVRSIESFDPATGKWSTVLEESPIDDAGIRMLPIQGRLLLYAPAAKGSREARLAIVAP